MWRYALALVLAWFLARAALAGPVQGFAYLDYGPSGGQVCCTAGVTYNLVYGKGPTVFFEDLRLRDDDFNVVWAATNFPVVFGGPTPVIDSSGHAQQLDINMVYEGPATYLAVGLPPLNVALGPRQTYTFTPAYLWLPDAVPEPPTAAICLTVLALVFMLRGILGARGRL